MDISKFRHTDQIQVRNYEIDWQGIVHNGNYLLYFEIARVNYFKEIGSNIDERSISSSVRIVLVHNEIDYFNSATFNDQLKIYTRVSSIKNSSFVCEAVMFNANTNILIAKNLATLVWTHPTTKKSVPVPNEFRRLVDKYEGGNAAILWPKIEV
ncbi:MAG: thioesterase family protein [Bacteroidota bacterium]|nr:thioesterase family protein [Bacteroidota bacterium]